MYSSFCHPRYDIGARTEMKKVEIFSIKKVREYVTVFSNLFGRKNEGIFCRIPHPMSDLGLYNKEALKN